MNTRITNRLLVALPLIFFSLDVFARAGGGGGSGSSGGGKGNLIALILVGIYSFIVTVALYIKVDKSRTVIENGEINGSFWNFEQMRDHSKRVFLKMQHAWMNRDINRVKDLISPRLYEDLKAHLEFMTENGEKNILSGIDIKSIKIIGCEDYLDNNQDSFIAHIKGSMLDYTINEKTSQVIKNADKSVETFTDTYHFIRTDNQWLLDYIDNHVSIWDIIKTRNYYETSRN
ncbi:MAG TPA: Tim44-like domain-containing protein [Prolixibacteraceae bacterium]|nr:Tim44-like domain-containing protein [Prolixibacteraceae bacterium]